MDLLSLTQFRHFKGCRADSELARTVLAKFPQLEPLFLECKPGFYNTLAEDYHLFAHEIAHMLDLVRKGKKERIKMENYGWPRIVDRGRWTLTMAKNEAEVFAYQWLLGDYFRFPKSWNDSVLDIKTIPIFLKAMVSNNLATEEFFKEYCQEAVMKQTEGLDALVHETMEYIVSEMRT